MVIIQTFIIVVIFLTTTSFVNAQFTQETAAKLSQQSFDLPQLRHICSLTFTEPYDRYNFETSNSLYLSSLSKAEQSPDIVYQKSSLYDPTSTSTSGNSGGGLSGSTTGLITGVGTTTGVQTTDTTGSVPEPNQETEEERNYGNYEFQRSIEAASLFNTLTSSVEDGDVALFADFGDVPIENMTYNNAIETAVYSYNKLALVYENHTYALLISKPNVRAFILIKVTSYTLDGPCTILYSVLSYGVRDGLSFADAPGFKGDEGSIFSDAAGCALQQVDVPYDKVAAGVEGTLVILSSLVGALGLTTCIIIAIVFYCCCIRRKKCCCI